jgi:hypothetical protein
VRHSAEEKPAPKDKVSSAVERLLGDVGAGKKHGSRHESIKLQKILAQARKEGIHVIEPGNGGGSGVNEGIDRILGQLEH